MCHVCILKSSMEMVLGAINRSSQDSVLENSPKKNNEHCSVIRELT